jgi:CheY-like chemotaxis protein/signal transduction histidine kinase
VLLQAPTVTPGSCVLVSANSIGAVAIISVASFGIVDTLDFESFGWEMSHRLRKLNQPLLAIHAAMVVVQLSVAAFFRSSDAAVAIIVLSILVSACLCSLLLVWSLRLTWSSEPMRHMVDAILCRTSRRPAHDLRWIVVLIRWIILLVVSIGEVTLVVIFFVASASHVDACPAFYRDLSLHPARERWPCLSDTTESLSNLSLSMFSNQSIWLLSVSIYVVATIAYLFASQANMASNRERAAVVEAQKLQEVLRYVSHEARSPLGGAILSLSLLNTAINHDDTDDATALVTELVASVDSTRLLLDDLLQFESSSGTKSQEGSRHTRSWLPLESPAIKRLRTSFMRSCEAEFIDLDFRIGQPDFISLAAPQFRCVRECLWGEKRAPQLAPQAAEALITSCASSARSHETALRQSKGSFPEWTGWEVYADMDAIVSVIQNAMTNSVKHVRGDGSARIEVSLWFERAEWAIPASERPSQPKSHPVLRPPEEVEQVHRKSSAGLYPIQRGGSKGAHLEEEIRRTSTSEAPSPSATSSALSIESGYVFILVLDNGEGIPEESLTERRLFKPFRMLRATDGALRMGSSGLGLSIVKTIVTEQFHGEVGIAAREGEGALFFAKIPVWGRPFSVALSSGKSVSGLMLGPRPASSRWRASLSFADDLSSSPTRHFAETSQAKPLALVVDDERVNRTLMARVLRRWGLDVIEVPDGLECTNILRALCGLELFDPHRRHDLSIAGAISPCSARASLAVTEEELPVMAKSKPCQMIEWQSQTVRWPSIITLDVRMPRMDGFEVLRQLRLLQQHLGNPVAARKLAKIKVISVTGNAVKDDATRLLELGAKAVLTKPVDLSELFQHVSQSTAPSTLRGRANIE